MTQNDQHDRLTRRRALAAGISLTVALTGCLGDDDESADYASEESDEDGSLEDDEAGTEADDTSEANGADDDADDGADDESKESTDEESDSDGEEGPLELLAEESVDHEHACLHAEFDEREPLEAGESAEDAPTVEETHTIWEVAVEGEGYVVFDAAAHEHDGLFVFYTAEGSADPVEGSEGDRDDVPDDECGELEEYVQVEPEEGRIILEVSPE